MTASSPPSPFHKLTLALERLERAMAEGPERTRALGASLAAVWAEPARDLPVEPNLAGPKLPEVPNLREVTDAPAADLQQAVEASSAALVSSLAQARATVEALQGTFLDALAAQRAQLARWQAIEAEAAETREEALAQRRRLLEIEEALRGEVQSRLDLAAQGARAAARAAGRLLVAQTSDQAAELNRQALAAYEEGRRGAALALLEQAAALAPADTTIALNLARLCIEEGQLARAEALLGSLTRADNGPALAACEEACGDPLRRQAGDSPALTYTWGLLALRQGDDARAVDFLSAAAEAAAGQPDEVAIRLRLAEAYYRAGHPQPAIREWRHVLTLDPDQPEARTRLEGIS